MTTERNQGELAQTGDPDDVSTTYPWTGDEMGSLRDTWIFLFEVRINEFRIDGRRNFRKRR
jgi:hypothetical protein